jgi:hypothetical protein
MIWLAAALALALGGCWLRLVAERYYARWRTLSLTARLRESRNRAEVFERALARLRADCESGKLQLNDDYRGLFERLTAEARGPETPPPGA